MILYHSGAYRKKDHEAENWVNRLGIMISFNDWVQKNFRRSTRERVMALVRSRRK